MELDVTKALLAPGTEYPFSVQETLPPQDVYGEEIAFDTVSLAGVFTAIDGAVQLRGEMTTTVHATCAMCLGPATVPLTVPFMEMFRKDANELEDEAFQFEGNKISLTQLALTLAMLNLPMRIVCREDCPGSNAYRTLKEENSKSSSQEETQRPFEALQSLLNDEADKAD